MFNKKPCYYTLTNICTKFSHGISMLASYLTGPHRHIFPAVETVYLTGPHRHIFSAVETVYLHSGSSTLFVSSSIQMLR